MRNQNRNALESLLDEKMGHFKTSFIESSRQLFVDEKGGLIHSGEFGSYREAVTKDFLKAFIPQRMGIDSGFVITSSGSVSTQCDLVIYDKSVTPLLQNENRQRFFPIESVCGVGEVKSNLSLNDLKDALIKLSKVKSLRDTLYQPFYVHCSKEEGFDPAKDEKDQIFTFLICESFSFDLQNKAKEIVSCYNESVPKRPFSHWHNLILSIKDGLFAYLHPSGVLFPFGYKAEVIMDYENGSTLKSKYLESRLLSHRVVMPLTDSSYEHIRHFCTLLHTGLNIISVFFPDMAQYIKDQDDVGILDIAR